MSSSTASRVFSGYRRLFRARKQLFGRDEHAMNESRIAIRAQFESNRSAVGDQHIEGLLSMVDEAEDMLLNGIVQGELNQETGNYQVKVKPQHTETVAQHKSNMEPITKEMGESYGNKPIVSKSSHKER